MPENDSNTIASHAEHEAAVPSSDQAMFRYAPDARLSSSPDAYVRLPLAMVRQFDKQARNRLTRAVCLAMLAEQLGPKDREAKLPRAKLLRQLRCSSANLPCR